MLRSVLLASTLAALPLTGGAALFGLPLASMPPSSTTGAGDAGTDELAAPTEPELQVPERVQDIGEVPFGKRIPVRFEVRNPGSTPVMVEEVKPVRGLSPALEVRGFTREIPPEGTGEIDLTLDTSKMVGPVQSPFQVFLEGAEEPMILEVAAQVRNYFAASPGRARWTYVHGEPTGTIVQHVWARGGEDFKILEVQSPPQFEVEFRPAGPEEVLEDKPEPQWLVAPTLRPDSEVGPITGALEVLTDHPIQERLLIPVSGFVRPALHLSPPTGDYGTVVVDEPKRGYFHLKAFSEKPVQIEYVEVVPRNEKVVAGVEVIQPGREYQISVSLLPGIAPGTYEGQLRIHTDSEVSPVMRAPVRVVIRAPENPTESSTD